MNSKDIKNIASMIQLTNYSSINDLIPSAGSVESFRDILKIIPEGSIVNCVIDNNLYPFMSDYFSINNRYFFCEFKRLDEKREVSFDIKADSFVVITGFYNPFFESSGYDINYSVNGNPRLPLGRDNSILLKSLSAGGATYYVSAGISSNLPDTPFPGNGFMITTNRLNGGAEELQQLATAYSPSINRRKQRFMQNNGMWTDWNDI